MTSEIILGEMGGGFKEEISLWINPSPSNTVTTLTPSWSSYGISEFRFIGFLFKYAINGSDNGQIMVYATPTELERSKREAYRGCIAAGATVTGGTYFRSITYVDDKSVQISSAQSSGSNPANYCIPLKIIGLR